MGAVFVGEGVAGDGGDEAGAFTGEESECEGQADTVLGEEADDDGFLTYRCL